MSPTSFALQLARKLRPEPGSVVCSQRGHSLIAGPVHTQLFSEHQAAAAAGNDDPGGLAPLAEGEAEEIAGKRRMRVRPNTVLVLCSCLGIGVSQWMAVVSSVLCVVYTRSRGRIRAKPACRAIRYRQITTRIDLDPCRRCAELWWFVWLQRGNSLAAGQLHTKLFSDKGKGPPALGSLAEGDDDSYAPRQQHSRSREETLSSIASFCPPCRD